MFSTNTASYASGERLALEYRPTADVPADIAMQLLGDRNWSRQDEKRDYASLDSDLRFDFDALFRRVTAGSVPDDISAVPGIYRGPVGGADSWEGRSPMLRMSRQVGCHGGSSNIVSALGSSKMCGLLGTESLRESDLAKLLDYAPNVRAVLSQADPVEFRMLGLIRRTTPDFYVDLYEGRRHLLEVKPKDKAARPESCVRAHAIKAACARMGLIYAVLTEDDIRLQPRLSNVKLLRRYRLSPITAVSWAAIAKAMQAGPQTIRALRAASGVRVETIYAAIYRDLLSVDMRLLLSTDSEVSL